MSRFLHIIWLANLTPCAILPSVLVQPPPSPILESPRDLLVKLLAELLRIMRTALNLSLVEFCTYALHKLLSLDLCSAISFANLFRFLALCFIDPQ